MKKTILALAFVSVALLFGCSADGFLHENGNVTWSNGGGDPGPGPGPSGNSSWCVNHEELDCNSQPACTSSISACRSGWSYGAPASAMELMSSCPAGYQQYTSGSCLN